jgi:hypothetical protein
VNEAQFFAPWRVVAEFADDSRLTFDGFTEEQARAAMEAAQNEHGDIAWWDHVTDVNYSDGQYYKTLRQLLNQMQEEMTKEYFKQESTTSTERLKVLEADAKMRLCTVHHLAPENVDVSGHETSPGTYTFTVTERIPVSTFTIPTN